MGGRDPLRDVERVSVLLVARHGVCDVHIFYFLALYTANRIDVVVVLCAGALCPVQLNGVLFLPCDLLFLFDLSFSF